MNSISNILVFKFIVFVLFMGCLVFCENYVEDLLNSGCDCGKNTITKSENEKEGYRKIKTYKIVNGYVPDHRPWMVYIENYHMRLPNSITPGRCGGSILNHRWIISAAHCFCDSKTDCILKKKGGKIGHYPKINYPYKGRKNGSIWAYVGLADITYKYKWKNNHDAFFKIKRVILNPYYRPNNPKHQHYDIALLYTYNKIYFKGSSIRHQAIFPICLPKTRQFSEEIMNKYPNVYVAGWGVESDPECNTNMYGPAPFTKCKLPFEYKGELHDRCLRFKTPAKYDTECEELRHKVPNIDKDFFSLNYSKIHVRNSNDQTITTCYPKDRKFGRKELGYGWCATCIPSAKKPGDRGYCRKTGEDQLPLSEKYKDYVSYMVPAADFENYKREMNVLENTTSPHWGVCSDHCAISQYRYGKKYRAPLPHDLTEAELSLLDDNTCNDILSNTTIGFNSNKELCAVKENKLKIRNFIKHTSGHNGSNGTTYYQEADDHYDKVYGKVDSCFGDSGNNMLKKSMISQKFKLISNL